MKVANHCEAGSFDVFTNITLLMTADPMSIGLIVFQHFIILMCIFKFDLDNKKLLFKTQIEAQFD